jgi:quercetin dioxygenase-like cupin family protein
MMQVPWNRRARVVTLACVALAGLALTAKTWATPPFGFILNQVFASGVAADGISQHVQINKNPDGSLSPWQLQLQVQGETDYYSHHLVLAPGGYSGWHSHPGLLIGTVKSGAVDFYTADCQKHTVAAGEVYTENDEVHGIVNTGAVDADLYLSYLIKHGQPRRRDEAAPACAVDTPIP